MDLENATIVDLETYGIGPRPDQYPPRIVGVGLRHPHGKREYLAFGHATGNNCTEQEAKNAVAFAARGPCVYHHAAFDMECIHAQWHIPYPTYWECTLIAAFLCYPHFKQLGLKPLGVQLFSDAPTERDAVVDWIVTNVPGTTKKGAMGHIPKAPGDLVGEYCMDDCERTHRLAVHLDKIIRENRMEAAYAREKLLTPHLIACEQRGIRVDRPLLEQYAEQLSGSLKRVEEKIGRVLGYFNFDSDEELADALQGAVLVHPDGWLRTATGKRQTSATGLGHVLHNTAPELLKQLLYRGKCATLQRTFVVPWLQMSMGDGRLHSRFNQTRGESDTGARTGRIASSDPNLQNVPTEQKLILPEGFEPLPLLRRALLPNEGEQWVSCDYSQIELRILAHLEDDALMMQYQRNPLMDMHEFVAGLIRDRLGGNVDRKIAKTISFATIYGAGVNKLAEQLGVPQYDAAVLKRAYMMSLPGVAAMQADIRTRGRFNLPVRTLGGRVYYAERGPDGRDFSYKLLNYAIQGGCADLLKQAIIDYSNVAPINGGSLLCTVYDEVNISLPADGDPEILRKRMCEAMKIDVPITADLEIGPNWADLVPYQHQQSERFEGAKHV